MEKTLNGLDDKGAGRVLRGEGVRHVERNPRGFISPTQEALRLGFSIPLKRLVLNKFTMYGVLEVKRGDL
jgi:hypothetical protein